jgi:hypothetical protein
MLGIRGGERLRVAPACAWYYLSLSTGRTGIRLSRTSSALLAGLASQRYKDCTRQVRFRFCFAQMLLHACVLYAIELSLCTGGTLSTGVDLISPARGLRSLSL